MQAKIKNLVPRIHGFGRIIQLKPGETKSLTDEQVEQLKRDRTIRALIIDKAIAVQPADLIDLEEDPDELDPVAVPPRRAGGFLDHKIHADKLAGAKKRSVAVKATMTENQNAWSNEVHDFDSDDEKKPVVRVPQQKAPNQPAQPPKAFNPLDRVKGQPVQQNPPKAAQQRTETTAEAKKEDEQTAVDFFALTREDQEKMIAGESNIPLLLSWFHDNRSDNDLKKIINDRGTAVAAERKPAPNT